MDDLKPCPFCRGTDYVVFMQLGCDDWQVVYEKRTCDARGPKGSTRHEAKVAWNRRAPAQEKDQ